jgi:hypothetical protein
MTIKVVGTGKYPNSKRAAKKGEQEKPKRKRHPSKVKSETSKEASETHKNTSILFKDGLLPTKNRGRAKKAKTGTKKGRRKSKGIYE